MGGNYGLVIAINGAILRYACDWAACNDRGMSMQVIKARKAGKLPRLKLLMSCYVWAAQRLGLELSLPPLYPRGMRYSLPNVIALACREFPGSLMFEFFGYDASAERDFDGRHGDHSPDRWRRELAAVREQILLGGVSAKGLPDVD